MNKTGLEIVVPMLWMWTLLVSLTDLPPPSAGPLRHLIIGTDHGVTHTSMTLLAEMHRHLHIRMDETGAKMSEPLRLSRTTTGNETGGTGSADRLRSIASVNTKETEIQDSPSVIGRHARRENGECRVRCRCLHLEMSHHRVHTNLVP